MCIPWIERLRVSRSRARMDESHKSSVLSLYIYTLLLSYTSHPWITPHPVIDRRPIPSASIVDGTIVNLWTLGNVGVVQSQLEFDRIPIAILLNYDRIGFLPQSDQIAAVGDHNRARFWSQSDWTQSPIELRSDRSQILVCVNDAELARMTGYIYIYITRSTLF